MENKKEEYTWNDSVAIKKEAPGQFHPGKIGVVCGMSEIKFEEIAKKYHSKLGDWIYTVEFEDGSDIQVAGCFLEENKIEISNFKILLNSIQCISNLEYQERIWIKHENPNIIDLYDDTTMYFLEDAYNILEARDVGRVKMTDIQYIVLKNLYKMVENYDMPIARPDEDKDIVNDPKWHEVVEYAKKAYDVLTREE